MFFGSLGMLAEPFFDTNPAAPVAAVKINRLCGFVVPEASFVENPGDWFANEPVFWPDIGRSCFNPTCRMAAKRIKILFDDFKRSFSDAQNFFNRPAVQGVTIYSIIPISLNQISLQAIARSI